MGKILLGILLGVLLAWGATYILKGDGETDLEGTTVSQANNEELSGGGRSIANAQALDPALVSNAAAPAEGTLVMPTNIPSSITRPEFDALFKSNPALGAQHAIFEREARDHIWASDVEANFQAAMASNHKVQDYGQPVVECRATWCEVRLLAYGASQVSAEDWPGILSLRSVFFDADGNRVNSTMGNMVRTNLGVIESGGASALVVNFQFSRADGPQSGP